MRKFLRLSSEERHLLFHAFALLVRARLTLWLVPFSRLSRPQVATRMSGIHKARLAWAVGVAARFIPFSTCLVRALGAQRLLAFHGLNSDLHIGVANSAEAGFQAHAWLECGGDVLLGRSATSYTPLLNWSSAQ